MMKKLLALMFMEKNSIEIIMKLVEIVVVLYIIYVLLVMI